MPISRAVVDESAVPEFDTTLDVVTVADADVLPDVVTVVALLVLLVPYVLNMGHS